MFLIIVKYTLLFYYTELISYQLRKPTLLFKDRMPTFIQKYKATQHTTQYGKEIKNDAPHARSCCRRHARSQNHTGQQPNGP